MRRFNFISRSALFTPTVYANVIAKRQIGIPCVRDFTAHNSVKKLIGNIHDAHFPGEFSDTDVANLRSDLTKSTKNYYQLLDVNPELEKDVFERELKQKYRALSLRFHPDCTAGHTAKTEIFKLIKNAYETLNDANFRDNYNTLSSAESDLSPSFFRGKHRSKFIKNPVWGKSLFSLSLDEDEYAAVKGISISKCGQYIAALTYQKLVIVDAKTNALLHQFSGNYSGISTLAFSADSKKIALFYHGSLQIVTLKTGRCIRSKEQENSFPWYDPWRMLRLNDGNFVSASISTSGLDDGSLKLWHGQTGRHIRTLTGHTRDVCALSMIPNSNHIISGSWDKTMKVWNMDTGNCEHTLSDFNDLISTVALSADAKYLVAGSSNGQFSIWDFERKKQIKKFKGYKWIDDKHGIQCAMQGILISPDSRYFASIANCPVVKIWEMESGKQVGEKTLPAYPQSVAHFGENTLIGFDDGTIREFTFSDFGYEHLHVQHMTPIPGK